MRFIFAILCAVFLATSATAELNSKDSFDFQAFDSTADRADEVVQDGVASTNALETLRADLRDYRSAALDEHSRHESRINSINERLIALGPAPAEGITESDEVAALRLSLNQDLAEAKAPALAAEEAYQRANGLIREIDTLIRQRSARELMTLEQSPLAPSSWLPAIRAVGSYAKQIGKEVRTNWNNNARSAVRIGNMPIVAVLFAIGLLLMARSRVWSEKAMVFGARKAPPRISNIASFVLSLAKLFLPLIGLTLLVVAIQLMDLFALRGGFLLDSIAAAGFALFFAGWLARCLLHPIGRQPAFVTVSPAERVKVHRAIKGLGWVFALNALIEAMDASKDLPDNAAGVLLFPVVLLGAFHLFTLGRIIVNRSRENAGLPQATPFMTKVTMISGNFSLAASIVGPVLSGIGYQDAGAGLIFATTLSLVLITAFYIMYRLIGMLTGVVADPTKTAVLGQSKPQYGALFRMALGFALVSLAVPLMALIWGARVSDIREVWLRLQEGVSFGGTKVSITDFLTLILVFSIGYLITRLLQSALKSNVLPNTRLDSGGQNAIVTGTGYVGIFLAALAAISATGLDLSNLAIVAGALSVGIGFGLQTIVSNFVSGIILLIERPIKEGDWIDVGTNSGYVRKISVRSTMVDTFDRATVVIPNADLIAGTVTNWTHGSMTGRVKVPVGVSYDSDPREVERILNEIALDHPMVLRDPAPSIVFMGFGADSLDFEIRAILRDVNWMLSARSDMNFEIMKRFTEAGIEIPFAQRDVNLKNIKELGEVLKPNQKDET